MAPRCPTPTPVRPSSPAATAPNPRLASFPAAVAANPRPAFFPAAAAANPRLAFFPGGNRAESPPSLLRPPPHPLAAVSSSWRRALPTAAPAAPAAPASRLLCSSQPAAAPSPSIVDGLLDYLNESWTQFHATAEAKRQLLDAGFKLLSENDDWDLQPGGRYFFTRNMSCLVAFAVGEKYRVGNGFNIIAAHTDSPCLKLKPRSAFFKSGHQMINVPTYGGGLWHTWFDRDLTLAGRVILRAADGSFAHKLVKVSRPLIRVPTLAIHLDRYTLPFIPGSKSDNT